ASTSPPVPNSSRGVSRPRRYAPRSARTPSVTSRWQDSSRRRRCRKIGYAVPASTDGTPSRSEKTTGVSTYWTAWASDPDRGQRGQASSASLQASSGDSSSSSSSSSSSAAAESYLPSPESAPTPSSARSRSRSVSSLLYLSWRATFTCLALARPRPIGSTPSNVRSQYRPHDLRLAGLVRHMTPSPPRSGERDVHQHPYRYNRTRFAPLMPTPIPSCPARFRAV